MGKEVHPGRFLRKMAVDLVKPSERTTVGVWEGVTEGGH